MARGLGRCRHYIASFSCSSPYLLFGSLPKLCDPLLCFPLPAQSHPWTRVLRSCGRGGCMQWVSTCFVRKPRRRWCVYAVAVYMLCMEATPEASISRSDVSPPPPVYRFRAKREQLKRFQGLLTESQGKNLALTVVYVPYGVPPSLASGLSCLCAG